jgi:molybdenum cofactor biosynthesis enzyme MoaA
MSGPGKSFPRVPFRALDTVWFQVAGTICNLRCTHCFISCAPDNHSHGMMGLEEVRRHLDEATRLGVKDYYFTGGEPFMNREIFDILEATLAAGPATVLTNGLLLDPGRARRLRALSDASPYSLDLRISLDGYDAGTHDAIRGPFTFARALAGARNLLEAGLNPVITVTEVSADMGRAGAREAFLERMRALGFERPRLKVLSIFRIGREPERSRAYEPWETLRGRTLTSTEFEALQCSSSRMVTSRGVYVCPILIDHGEARMGASLAETRREFPLAYGACFTCHAYGVTCRT